MKYDNYLDITIIAAVNDEETLKRNLLRSPILATGRAEVRCYRNEASASGAYNKGLRNATSKYVAFVHQDVYLPGTWEENLRTAISSLDYMDSKWAVLGAIGLSEDGVLVGRVWSSGLAKELGRRLDKPVKVNTLDELLIVIKRDSGCEFDNELPGFHLYGTDIVQIAKACGFNSYVADLPVIHNSRPVQFLGSDFVKCYKYMKAKWNKKLPLNTLIVPIKNLPFSLFVKQLKILRTRPERIKNAISPTTDPKLISERLHYD